MDMDMDIGWCLTCAKRTPDQRIPYCSETCRQADTHTATPATDPLVITSPLPPQLIPLPPASPRVAPVNRGIDGNGLPSPMGQQRDRRAFSFPSSEDEGVRPSLPTFNRKPKAVNSTGRSFKRRSNGGYSSPGGLLLSTGTSTPTDTSALYTSDSERESQPAKTTTTCAAPRPPLSPLASLAALHPTHPLPKAVVRNPEVPIMSPVLEVRPSSPNNTRMATSSSRSREDIISWARAVDARGDYNSEGTVRRSRGRRHPNSLASLPHPSTEPLDQPHQDNTPRGTSALNALNMTFGPVVTALRSVSLVSVVPPESPAGLQSNPADAAVSKVDVVVGTRYHDDILFAETATPTLSTMSLSEAVDTSNATDLGETIETATDDFSVTSSHYRTPPIIATPVPDMEAPAAPRTSLQHTAASVIWNFSNYLRSLAPFTTPFSLVMTGSSTSTTPKNTVPTPAESDRSAPVLAPVLGVDLAKSHPHSSAVPAAPRSEMTETYDPQELVRSVPMNIVMASGKAQAIAEERARERELGDARSRSRSRSRGARERSHTPPQRPVGARNSMSESRNDDGRGRRRTRRRDEREETQPPTPEPAPEEQQRGRRRDRVCESRERSWSAARGRTSRTRPAAPPAVRT